MDEPDDDLAGICEYCGSDDECGPDCPAFDEFDPDDDSPSIWGPCVICKANLVNYGAGDDTCHACLKSLYGAR